MSGEFGRLEVLAALLLLTGLVISVRSAGRLAQVVRARSTYGAPYRSGQIADRLLAFLMTIPVLLAGLVLAFLGIAQAAFQPDATTVRVGRLIAGRSESGATAVRFVPDPLYPGQETLEGEVSGSVWAVAGDSVEWAPWAGHLGLRSGHRLRYLLGSSDPSGLERDAGATTVLEPLPAASDLLIRLAPYLPFLTVTRDTSPWFRPAGHTVMTLYAVGPGYLADEVSEADDD